MSDELKRAMEALESAAAWHIGGVEARGLCHEIACEHERAVEQARKDEREACRLIAKMGHEEECDCLVCHDVADPIRARGAR